MKTINVSEATNTQLDWLVAKTVALEENQLSALRIEHGRPVLLWDGGEPRGPRRPCNYTTDWSLMGPIIEREGPWVRESAVASPAIAHLVTPDKKWFAYARSNHDGTASHCYYGETFLIAAARCYVASKLDDTVEVPEELS
jgi:hypothetical protein